MGHNMTHEEKYKVYCEMFEQAHEYTERLTEAITGSGNYTYYSVFVAVGREEEYKFFCDIETSDNTPGGYSRVYGLRTAEQIEKLIQIYGMNR